MNGTIVFLITIVYLLVAALGSTAAEGVDVSVLVPAPLAVEPKASATPSLRTPLLRQVQAAAVPAAPWTTTTTTGMQRQRRQQEQGEEEVVYHTKLGHFFDKQPVLAIILYIILALIGFFLFIVIVIVMPCQILLWACNWCFALAAQRASGNEDSQDQQDIILAEILASQYNIYSSKPKPNHDDVSSLASSSTAESTDATIDCDEIRAEMVDVDLRA